MSGIEVIPAAKRLIKSLRDLGYDFAQAVADVVDNSIEAGATLGWPKWVGAKGAVVGIDKFGASAPAEAIFENYGFNVANVVATVKKTLR